MAEIPGFGVELKELKYDGFLDWLVTVNDFWLMWRAQPTYVLVFLLFIFGGLLTCIHALNSGKRFFFLWLGTIFHGLFLEAVCYVLPDIDNFWHSETPIMLFGHRMSFHILLLYPVFIYNSSMAVRKLGLPSWCEPFAVGLGSVLVDLPYDIMSIKFVHWTWHDTDPNIFDRHYFVPWNSYFFHVTFAASYTFFFHQSRKLFANTGDKWTAHSSWLREFVCTVIPGVLGMPGGVLIFTVLYHTMHDIYKVHSEVTFFVLFAIFMGLTITGLRYSEPIKALYKRDLLLLGYLLLHYSYFLGMAIFGDPSTEIAIGLHEPVGPCDETQVLTTALGHKILKRKYLCLSKHDEDYFDFHCLPKERQGGPANGAIWYTICGREMENRAEYILIISAICAVAFFFFANAYIFKGKSIKESAKEQKLIKKKKV